MKRCSAAGLVLSLSFLAPVLSGFVRQSNPALVNVTGIASRVDDWIQPYVTAGDFSGVVLIAAGPTAPDSTQPVPIIGGLKPPNLIKPVDPRTITSQTVH